MAAADAVLVERVLAGESDAFEALVGRHLDRARAIAGAVVGDPSAVDDVVQEAFLRAYDHLGSLSDPAAFPGWLARIVHNQGVSWLRRNRRRDQEALGDRQLPAAEADEHDDDEQQTRLARLEAAMAQLRPAYREILALKYEARLNYDEIAETLQTSVANVEKKLYRARQRLQQLMG